MLKSPDAVARTTTFTHEVKDRSKYQHWLASKAVSSPHNDEMIIAWHLSKVVHVTPTQLIRGLRAQKGLPAGLIDRLRRIVEANPSIKFEVDADGVQRTVFTAGAETGAQTGA